MTSHHTFSLDFSSLYKTVTDSGTFKTVSVTRDIACGYNPNKGCTGKPCPLCWYILLSCLLLSSNAAFVCRHKCSTQGVNLPMILKQWMQSTGLVLQINTMSRSLGKWKGGIGAEVCSLLVHRDICLLGMGWGLDESDSNCENTHFLQLVWTRVTPRGMCEKLGCCLRIQKFYHNNEKSWINSSRDLLLFVFYFSICLCLLFYFSPLYLGLDSLLKKTDSCQNNLKRGLDE